MLSAWCCPYVASQSSVMPSLSIVMSSQSSVMSSLSFMMSSWSSEMSSQSCVMSSQSIVLSLLVVFTHICLNYNMFFNSTTSIDWFFCQLWCKFVCLWCWFCFPMMCCHCSQVNGSVMLVVISPSFGIGITRCQLAWKIMLRWEQLLKNIAPEINRRPIFKEETFTTDIKNFSIIM